MPVLTKINTNSIAEDAITGDKFAGDAYLANTANQNISGTYSENRLYTSDAYTLSGNATVNSHLTLSSVKPTADVVLTASGAYTITGTGVLSAGSLLAKERSDLTGMTGELGSVVTGAPAITGLGTVTSGTYNSTIGSSATFPTGHVIKTYSDTITGAVSTTSTSYVDTGLAVTLITSRGSSKFYCSSYFIAQTSANMGHVGGVFCLERSGVDISAPAGDDFYFSQGGATISYNFSSFGNIHMLDSPNVGAGISLTYKIKMKARGSSPTLRIGHNGSDSFLTIFEIA